MGEVNALTGMYIRAMGLHLRNPFLAADVYAAFFKDWEGEALLLRDVQANGRIVWYHTV